MPGGFQLGSSRLWGRRSDHFATTTAHEKKRNMPQYNEICCLPFPFRPFWAQSFSQTLKNVSHVLKVFRPLMSENLSFIESVVKGDPNLTIKRLRSVVSTSTSTSSLPLSSALPSSSLLQLLFLKPEITFEPLTQNYVKRNLFLKKKPEISISIFVLGRVFFRFRWKGFFWTDGQKLDPVGRTTESPLS